MIPIDIHSETPQDGASIADINVQAFGDRMYEAMVVALMRQTAHFDPELSLVAWSGGQPVGHALFSPQRVRLFGEPIPAVSLGPIAVLKAFQRQGIGRRLIAEGHKRALEKGAAFCFLLGHPTYYPRLGYRQHAFGAASVSVALRDLPQNAWEPRAPVEADVPALCALWRHEEGRVDFALEPGTQLLDWLSPHLAIQTLVYTEGNEIVGFARVSDTEPLRPRCFLAQSGDVARRMAGALGRRTQVMPDDSIILPLHSFSSSASAFDAPTVDAWAAAMIFPLQPSAVDRYYAAVRSGERPAGRLTWPVAFDKP
jgi:putative acetyltransferase